MNTVLLYLRRALPGGMAAAALLPAWALAAGLQISQVSDRPPELLVFLAEGGTAASATAGTAAGFSAVLGSTTLPVKSLGPWDASAGIALVVAIDVSASLGTAGFDAVKRQVGDLLAGLPASSQVALIAIGTDVRTVRPFAPLAAGRLAALDAMAADSPRTALYEGVLAAQALAQQRGEGLPARRGVLLVTDGLDDSDKGFGRDEVLRKIAVNDAPVFALALAPRRMPRAQADAVGALAQIARASGGSFVHSDAAGLGDGLKRLSAQMLQAELVVLDCAACERDGAPRMLQLARVRQGETATDAREIRLFHVPAAAGEGAARAPAPEEAGPPWFWGLLTVLVLGAIGAAGLLWRRQAAGSVEQPAGRTPVAMPPDDDLLRVEDDQRTAAAAPSARQGGIALTLDVAGAGRTQVVVGSADLVFGRAPGADIPVRNDAQASSRHAALYRQNGVLLLRDLGSSNGTFLNGTRIARPEPVQDRDLIGVGSTEVRVYVGQT